MPNHRFVKVLTDSRMSGAALISACTCSTSSGIIRATISTARIARPNRSRNVARPRRQPRLASQSTAGSRANDANRAITAQISRSRTFRKNARKTIAESQATAIAPRSFQIQGHGGSRSSASSASAAFSGLVVGSSLISGVPGDGSAYPAGYPPRRRPPFAPSPPRLVEA